MRLLRKRVAPDAARPALHEIAAQQRWGRRRPHRAFWEMVAEEVTPRSTARVVVVGKRVRTARRTLLEHAPGLRVTMVKADSDVSETHVRLSIRGPYDVVIDLADAGSHDQVRLFRRTFWHLRPDGVYLVRQLLPHTDADADADAESDADTESDAERDTGTDTALAAAEAAEDAEDAALLGAPEALPNENLPEHEPEPSDLWGMLSEAQEARLHDLADHRGVGVHFRDIVALAGALGRLEIRSKMLRLVKAMPSSPKLREEEVDAVLEKRPGIGALLDKVPATSWRPDVDYHLNRPQDPFVPATFHCTALSLRRYQAPTCSRGQIVTSRNLLLPETFRHHWMRRMVNIYVVEQAPLFGRVRRNLSDPEHLPGAYYHLDSEWPGHFGHLLTEQVSRLWAFAQARELEPGIKLLTTLQHDREPAELLGFEKQVLAAFDITPDDVHVFDSPCVPERLYTATPMFSLPAYVHPDMVRIWDRIAEHLLAGATPRSWPERIFVSRRPSLKRSCHNGAEVEEYFRAAGFEVVYPEDHPLSDQVAMFRAAEVIAGFAGSGLFSLAFTDRPKQVFSLAPDSYTARNEYLIAATRGHRLTSVWSKPDVAHPAGSWTQEAFGSSFTFDFDDEGRFLAERLALLER
ncbi:glycosyltransferase family 61 protein [Nocardioides sp. zg-536]|uniref:Glycosyltransferase family 61 protein n=1 Tax=Nocardioides faecalis TaxID=2803858 RepID=A0A939BWV9_9ACTN|nr:glycosyltransferase 61 family protein [Nocardioides faecalis]MBM9461037.1 glycosyltransferase family 61 protein [Nocardioides faecalis]QVI59124.1 glycosyltransferase family 61 protein [Nocardioides faecalis]